MIEETLFTEDLIKKIVKKKYDIDVFNIKKLDRGSANIYSLNNDKYILKEFQSKYTKAEIDKEIKIINHLKKDGIPVPEYISTLSNRYCFMHKGKVVIMQKYIEGYTMESNTGSEEQMLECAFYYGKIVKSLKKSKIRLGSNDISEWYSKQTLDESIEKHKALIDKISKEKYAKIYDDLNDKISMLKYVRDNMDLSEIRKVTVTKTHGDYNVLQFIYKDGKIKAIIDFVSACKMPIIWEIIRSYSYIDSKAKDGIIDINNFVKYVKEVCKNVKLNSYDFKYMPYLYMIQILTSTFGYKQYIADNAKTTLLNFAYFRTNLCKFLFENASKISDALIASFVEK